MDDLPEWVTPADAKLTLETDLLVVVTKYGGEPIVAGPCMDQMNADLYDLIVSERTRQLVERIQHTGRQGGENA